MHRTYRIGVQLGNYMLLAVSFISILMLCFHHPSWQAHQSESATWLLRPPMDGISSGSIIITVVRSFAPPTPPLRLSLFTVHMFMRQQPAGESRQDEVDEEDAVVHSDRTGTLKIRHQ